MEWGRWPIFLSQSLAPLLLLGQPWIAVIAETVILNVLWALFVRYQFVSLRIAEFGADFVRKTKWYIWAAATVYLLAQKSWPEWLISARWPVLIFPLGVYPRVEIGRLQTEFMRQLGYGRRTH